MTYSRKHLNFSNILIFWILFVVPKGSHASRSQRYHVLESTNHIRLLKPSYPASIRFSSPFGAPTSPLSPLFLSPHPKEHAFWKWEIEVIEIFTVNILSLVWTEGYSRLQNMVKALGFFFFVRVLATQKGEKSGNMIWRKYNQWLSQIFEWTTGTWCLCVLLNWGPPSCTADFYWFESCLYVCI